MTINEFYSTVVVDKEFVYDVSKLSEEEGLVKVSERLKNISEISRLVQTTPQLVKFIYDVYVLQAQELPWYDKLYLKYVKDNRIVRYFGITIALTSVLTLTGRELFSLRI